jgi:hypothetical protein
MEAYETSFFLEDGWGGRFGKYAVERGWCGHSSRR